MSFVHLHCHSEFSALDGLSTIDEAVAQAVSDDQPALAITDHGVCAGHPALSKAANKAGIKPIFGLEAYFVEDRHRRPEKPLPDATEDEVAALKAKNALIRGDYYHLILLAKNDAGLKNLWALSTESYKTGLYYNPRMDWECLEKHSEGLIATTACLRGPISVPILNDEDDIARARLGKLLNIFGDDLYVELHTNQLDKQIKLNKILVEYAQEYSLPLIAVTDSHYAKEDDHAAHKTWIAVQTNSDVQDEGDLFGGDQDYFVMPEVRIKESLFYLHEATVERAIENTVTVAELCNADVRPNSYTPVYTRAPKEGETGENEDIEKVLQICLENWAKTYGKRHDEKVYRERFEKEMKLLVEKGFCGYFLMVWDYVAYAKRNHVLVGPGRGSGGGSLIAYLMGITSIDPVEAELLFERFMTEGRTELPDFDVDFPTSKRDFMQKYVIERYGQDRVVRVGTHSRLRNKGVVQNLGRAMRSTLPPESYQDLEQVSKIIGAAEKSTAGLGIPWEELWAQEGDLLDRYREKYPELFGMADKLVGRLKTYGRHAAGLVIATEGSLTESLPLRAGEEGESMISQFEMNDLMNLGYLKFDFLTLRTLDTLQMCLDLLRDQGIVIDLEQVPYDDEKVWEEISLGHTMGVFQIETTAGTRLARRMKPNSMGDLADMGALVRPGPSRSGLTDTYLKRRFGEEEVSFQDPRLESVLARTYGTLLYQEDIMATCMVLAGYDSNKADEVRKILGKKLVDKAAAAGVEFVQGAVARGMKRDAAVDLWNQMAEFAKYSFGRAHAWGYAMLGYWCAWIKINYPSVFLVACLSTVEQERISDFIHEARRMGFSVLPPDVNESGQGFMTDEDYIRYGLDAIKGVGEVAVKGIIEGQRYRDLDDLVAKQTVNKGIMRLLARVGALENLPRPEKLQDRKMLVTFLEDPEGEQCRHLRPGTTDGPNGLPCGFDWSSEPVLYGKTGKPLKPKELPKKCFRGCRQYSGIPRPVHISIGLPHFTESEIQKMEMDLLGAYITSSPFDRIPTQFEDDLMGADDLLLAENGYYLAAGILGGIRQRKDARGGEYAFITLRLRDGDIDAVVFSSTYSKVSRRLKQGELAVAELQKTDRGYTVRSYLNI